jgi:hypothetical protein
VRYTVFAGLILAGALAVAPSLSAQAEEIPAGLQGRQASQVVTQLLGLRAHLMLSDAQVTQLSALRTSFLGKTSRFGRGPRARHRVRRPVASSTVAYRKATAILSPTQRSAAFQLLDRGSTRNTGPAPSDPRVDHPAGPRAPPAGQGNSERLDPLLHGTGQAPAEPPPAGRTASRNPITHRD